MSKNAKNSVTSQIQNHPLSVIVSYGPDACELSVTNYCGAYDVLYFAIINRAKELLDKKIQHKPNFELSFTNTT